MSKQYISHPGSDWTMLPTDVNAGTKLLPSTMFLVAQGMFLCALVRGLEAEAVFLSFDCHSLRQQSWRCELVLLLCLWLHPPASGTERCIDGSSNNGFRIFSILIPAEVTVYALEISCSTKRPRGGNSPMSLFYFVLYFWRPCSELALAAFSMIL